MKSVVWSSRVGAETVVVELDDQHRIRIMVDVRPGGPILVCTPTEAAMLALSLQQAAAAAGPAYAKKHPVRLQDLKTNAAEVTERARQPGGVQVVNDDGTDAFRLTIPSTPLR